MAANESIRWIDLRDASARLPAGIAREAALARFHVVQANGAAATGAAAFLRLWRGYRLFLPLRPLLAPLLPVPAAKRGPVQTSLN